MGGTKSDKSKKDVGANLIRSHRGSKSQMLEIVGEQQIAFFAAIGRFNNAFEGMAEHIKDFLSQCFVYGGLKDDQMAKYVMNSLDVAKIIELLDPLYEYSHPDDAKGITGVKDLRSKINQINNHRTSVIHGFHVWRTWSGQDQSSMGISFKKMAKGKPNPVIIHAGVDIENNADYTWGICAILNEAQSILKENRPIATFLDEFNKTKVPIIGITAKTKNF